MDNEFIKWLATLGVGGAIAGLIFYFYRKDVRSALETWKETALMLTGALKDSTAAHVENTQTNREMISLLRAVHRRLDADQAARGHRQ
jgi:hypothetical protein